VGCPSPLWKGSGGIETLIISTIPPDGGAIDHNWDERLWHGRGPDRRDHLSRIVGPG
jgi:hypothetical protein